MIQTLARVIVPALVVATWGGVATLFPAAPAAHTVERITVQLGDTIWPRYSLRAGPADTSLDVASTGGIVARRCGEGAEFLRNWDRSGQISADSVYITVVGCATPGRVTVIRPECDTCSIWWWQHTERVVLANGDTAEVVTRLPSGADTVLHWSGAVGDTIRLGHSVAPALPCIMDTRMVPDSTTLVLPAGTHLCPATPPPP